MSVLTQDLSKSGRPSPGARINFAVYDKKKRHVGRIILTIAAILTVFSAVFYFGMFVRYQEVNEKRMTLEDAKAELEDVKRRVKEMRYDSITEDYIRYSYDYLNDTEKSYANRILVLNLMEEKIFSIGNISSFSLTGNKTSFSIKGMTLKEASDLARDIEEYDVEKIVKSIDPTEATGDKTGRQSLSDTTTINFTIVFNTDAEREAAKAQAAKDAKQKGGSK